MEAYPRIGARIKQEAQEFVQEAVQEELVLIFIAERVRHNPCTLHNSAQQTPNNEAVARESETKDCPLGPRCEGGACSG